MNTKEKLIKDIENLLNDHGDVSRTSINNDLLQFMSETDLKEIISSLLIQKDNQFDTNREWLKQFKKP